MERIESFDQYRDLALRTLAMDVKVDPLKVTMNAACGLSSEVGEIVELMQGVEIDSTHMQKELGDWMWYWSLMGHAYGLANSFSAMTDMVPKFQSVLQETEDWAPHPRMGTTLVIETGAINEFVKKHWFHKHTPDVAVMGRLLYSSLRAWIEIVNHYGYDASEILGTNIEKLRKRYPEGFSTERSLNRAPGDI